MTVGDPKQSRGNVRSAPFALSSSVIRSVLGVPGPGTRRVEYVEVLPIQLVDQPMPSANPANRKANDNHA